MYSSDILIIGAGACGLIAARELSRKGKSVTVLEAQPAPGGRIRTITDHEFPKPLESGAEFIHGELPVTLSLLKEYGIEVQPMGGTFWQTRTDHVKKKNNFIAEHQRELARRLEELKQDMPVERFLELNFKEDEYDDMKNSVRGFVSGYDAADTSRASTFSFRDEWLNDSAEQQFRIPEGYGKLIDKITDECIGLGCSFHFSSRVHRIEWKRNQVAVDNVDGNRFTARRLIVTVPLGLLQGKGDDKLIFSPPLEQKEFSIQKLGYGGVIKICMLFKQAFWKSEEVSKNVHHNLQKLGFVFSDASIPTWWTQYPGETPLLTGWIGGKPAEVIASGGEDAISKNAIDSLAAIFLISDVEIRSLLLSTKIFDWVNDPYSRGAYSYEVVEGKKLKANMRIPEDDTLYFAGEAYHAGESSGTVEAALSEGFRVVRDIIS